MKPDDILSALELGTTTLGIEYGSTRIKAVLNGPDNTPIAIGTHDWENSFVDGYWTYAESELHEGLVAAYASLKRDVSKRYGVVLRRIGALGISAMMHGYLPFDAEGRLLVPFRTWRNTTTTQAAQELSELFAFHVPERWSVAHIYQAILDREEHVPRIAFFTTLAGYAHWKLTGKQVLSVGDASGMFPIDAATRSYDAQMLAKFNERAAAHNVSWKIEDLLPQVLLAGEVAGTLSQTGALWLDPEGDLEAGCPLCPPEGDAGTGMIATNAVAPRTGNVSAGTSVFSMVVLEGALKDPSEPTIDLVATPVGDPVAMVHCNNCSSDINAWMELFSEIIEAMGTQTSESAHVDKAALFSTLFSKALEGESDGGGLVPVPFISGEPIVGVQTGCPLLVRRSNAHLSLANFMRTAIMAAFGSLALGHEALKKEGVVIEKLYGHGGIFKTEGVAQRLLAAALGAPVSVMQTAGEGGAWGQALAASYMLNKKEGETLSEFLNHRVFSEMQGSTIAPDEKDEAGFVEFLASFKAALEVEKTAEKLLS